MSNIKLSRAALIQNYLLTGIGYVAVDYMGQKLFPKNEVVEKVDMDAYSAA